MDIQNGDLKVTLEKTIISYLQTGFRLRGYDDDPDDPLKFIVNGIITRHGKPANVKVSVNKEGIKPWYWSITDDDIIMPLRLVGQLELGKDVCVTDPCYTRDVWCMTQLHNVKPGIWAAWASIDTIDTWGERTYVLELQHSSLTKEEFENMAWSEYAELGVDSGTMSVIDDRYYRRKNGSAEAFESDTALRDKFSDVCFALSSQYAGIYHANNKAVGVVCSSGCGDGGYPLEVSEIDGEIVAMRINFM